MEQEKLESKIENSDVTPNFGKLDQLANEAKETQSENGFMQPKAAKETKKRGRKSKEELAKIAAEQKRNATNPNNPQDPQNNPQPHPQMSSDPLPPSAESLMMGKFTTKAISNLGVTFARDARASMTPDELEAGAEVIARLMDKYMPALMGQYGLEAGALMIFGQYGLRVMAVAKAKKIEEIEKQKKMHEQMNKPPEPVKPEPDSYINNPFPEVEPI